MLKKLLGGTLSFGLIAFLLTILIKYYGVGGWLLYNPPSLASCQEYYSKIITFLH